MSITAPTMKMDAYKQYHMRGYHPDVTRVYSNFTNRSGRLSNIKNGDGVVFVGLQYFILEYLIDEWKRGFFNIPKEDACRRHNRIMSGILGYDVDTKYLEDLHDLGYLPLRIKALQEGTFVPYGVPCLTITNTVDGFHWLPNYIETVLSSENWIIQTSATTAREYLKNFKKYFKQAGLDDSLIPFMGHDFSYRGMCGSQAAAMSGFGHLASGFAGTDTIPAVLFAEKYYGADVETELVGASVDATEHSVQCSFENDDISYIEHCMKKTPTGILSVVSDGYDFWKLITEYLPQLKDKIIERNGKLVIRPDSGDPVEILCGVEVENIPDKYSIQDWASDTLRDKIVDETPHGEHGAEMEAGYFRQNDVVYKATFRPEWNRYDKQYYYIDGGETEAEEVQFTAEQKGLIECLWNIFGGIETEKGYRVLDEHIGAIYGDSITLERQKEICERLLAKRFAPTVVLGIGSFTYQYVTRDTHSSAVKATAVMKNGEWKEIFKDPKTDSKKKSLKGLLRVEEEDGQLVVYDQQTVEEEQQGVLTTVFEDGKLFVKTDLRTIRENISKGL
jgi:nicotinamide phosphoribosyltransferase